MAAAYFAAGFGTTGPEHVASFELFVRSLPRERSFLVVSGVDAALAGIDDWVFDERTVDFLRSQGRFDDAFLDALTGTTFTGSVRAVPEGEVVFGGEPVLEVTAPIVQAQLLETFLLNQVTLGTMIASKAARVALACRDRSFVDFSARRDHGTDAALAAARAALIAGASGTSLVEAGRRFGAPLSGTMAHAFVMAFDDERDAFRAYARTFPDSTVLLVDTYDTIEGTRHAVEVAQELTAEGIRIRGVRLDSGDLAVLSKEVRGILDAAGFDDVRIFASGDLDEHRIEELVSAGAPIDAFGVGTRMGTSADAPSLSTVYKLVEDWNGPKMKLSEGKATAPGRKQVWRAADHDVISLLDETVPGARPLLHPAERDPSIEHARARCRDAIDALPRPQRSLTPPSRPYEVRHSAGLDALTQRLVVEHTRG
jgi:nicotinate phosphoribosyltransferase